jgi:hypothetical protein
LVFDGRLVQNRGCMSRPFRVSVFATLLTLALWHAPSLHAGQPQAVAPVKVFLDCSACFADFLRADVAFVDYVRDRTEAEVHALITRAQTGAGGFEYTLAFTGQGRFQGVSETLRTVTTISDTDDVVRRQLATALRVGLLRFAARDVVPAQLGVRVSIDDEQKRAASARDPWRKWVFSLRGSASFEGEESSRQRELGARISADRITPDWKVSLAGSIDQEREEFDLDEETPVSVERRERDLNWVIVNGLGEHWSIGAAGELESSTFDNTKLSVTAYPAIEYNVFPYSMYTRRQLRAAYGAGLQHARYYERTLLGRLEETRPRHTASLTLDQRERWGTLEARLEWSQYLHDLSKSRLEADGELSVRIARGLSVAAELSASRIRDQLSLPARGATAEEVLLRLRQLQSGYEYGATLSLTYTFGSIFSSVVNPRFGQ